LIKKILLWSKPNVDLWFRSILYIVNHFKIQTVSFSDIGMVFVRRELFLLFFKVLSWALE